MASVYPDIPRTIPLGSLQAPWEATERSLWDVCDMIFWAITNYAGMYGQLDTHIQMFETMAKQQPQIATTDIAIHSKKLIADSVVAFVMQEAKILNLAHTLQMANQLSAELKANKRYSAELLVLELRKLKQLIVMESSKRKLAYIPAPNDEYFGQEKLFGAEVFDTFPEARQDVQNAGNAIAASLPDATVFYLMRVAEYGLRRLAKKLRVRLTHKGKQMPIELADWNKILTQVRNQLTALHAGVKNLKQQAKLDFYSSVADHCEYMKEMRNAISHTRKSYNDPEAIGALRHVRGFMQLLAKQL